ncbi:SIS domain-containing protein [Streptococcus pseudoporcinus]|uniref:Tagatose-6-phosphate aldose/ketose isomerase n=1 Tax=Streptococcus pseudoporcinus TaxID=361101 RepID=A0A4U9XKK1_9STRE|nr:SIS domain-containing protein [Streptococcus pseudoporcinus]VTS13362.1 tagatose-6-phosphate aldose/ketose isomerase [Streptococcus pseudoporcinus]VUC66545.1 tagatose-6-phosphate aldose/ketose isomerase [Streptococcus pseudoporcinus]VUC97474.1 tagatose-6-phosphate aldose/ketose isomerase [Streptococcus pseudoporcinus]VUC97865.1 tagatose-6-phosphate aldose/ketose isomerase [Streptococcus pseudoporcinus]
MFQLTEPELNQLGAAITTKEIKQEPDLWEQVYQRFLDKEEELSSFLNKIIESADTKVKVIFTGAGTSEYVGNSIWSFLQTYGQREQFLFYSIASTDLVSAPHYYLYEEDTVLLVSFARSGNSPESIAAVDLTNQLVANCYHLTITCAEEGELAKRALADKRHFLLLMPPRSNDAGFAMTGSFTCMMLSALLIFDKAHTNEEKLDFIIQMKRMAEDIINREPEISDLMKNPFDRIVYLGSGSLAGLTQEAQLKILELTAGKIATLYDSSMGFRHGPKSFINEQTVVFGFVNNHTYTRQYDLDILEEIASDQIAQSTIAIGQRKEKNFSGKSVVLNSDFLLPDAYLAFPMIVFAQTVALLASIKVNNLPDTPSESGTVNRVVKGVRIYDYLRE